MRVKDALKGKCLCHLENESQPEQQAVSEQKHRVRHFPEQYAFQASENVWQNWFEKPMHAEVKQNETSIRLFDPQGSNSKWSGCDYVHAFSGAVRKGKPKPELVRIEILLVAPSGTQHFHTDNISTSSTLL